MEDMEGEGPSKNLKRYKVQCKLCKKTFNKKHSSNDNKKHDSNQE